MTFLKTCLGGALVAAGLQAAAHADATFPNFIVPALNGHANSTYQEWGAFTNATGANPATLATNTAGTPAAFDATASTDGAFLTGGHIYSFSAATSPAITVPNFNLGTGWTTQVVLQIETLGSEVDLASLSLTPAGGTAIAPTVTTLLHQDIESTPFGDSANDDYLFSWTVPGNASAYTLNMTASGPSMSWAGARVDTVATAVPEPASLALLATGALLLLRRKK